MPVLVLPRVPVILIGSVVVIHVELPWIDRMDREGMHGAVSAVERDIFTRYKRMRSEKEAGFIIVLVRHIIVKNPATMFGAPGLTSKPILSP